MENGVDTGNGDAEIRTLNLDDSVEDAESFDAFSSPVKSDHSNALAEADGEIHRLKEEKSVLETELEQTKKSLEAVAGQASRLEGDVESLRNELFMAESAADEADGRGKKLQLESDALKKAIEDKERENKEAEEKHEVEKERLLGQIDLFKSKLISYEDELTQLREKNTALESEVGNSRESATVLAAKAHEERVELMERNVFLEGEIVKKREMKEDDDVIVVKELKNPPNWVTNAACASGGAALTVVLFSIYLKLKKQQ